MLTLSSVPAAVVVMITTLQLTYLDFVRESLTSLLVYTLTYFYVRTGTYTLWTRISYKFSPEYIRFSRDAAIENMKKEARAGKRCQVAKQREEMLREKATDITKDVKPLDSCV